ncbi:hypothetical protein [Bosea sp. BIWAKO-01]|uniref:hypothetical protein n=1 Tax=Bosea sp. BIWAKO-01 TaxID=506668 RepID=UPI00086BE6AC|nr:hypothetical protein [Bosea sp. BIWAKO-01]GAU80179.1 hypothetical protein BIWAKO_00065 [Bosea sp. BIWAKO-01]
MRNGQEAQIRARYSARRGAGGPVAPSPVPTNAAGSAGPDAVEATATRDGARARRLDLDTPGRE